MCFYLSIIIIINIYSQLFNYLFFKGHLRYKHSREVNKLQIKENELCISLSLSLSLSFSVFFFISSLNFLNRIPNMALVVTLLVSAHRGYRASQEARDPRDQLVQRDHPGITDPKDLWVHEESRAMKDSVENRDF